MSNSILIFTDGASKGNPGPGGWGAVISFGGKIVEIGGAEKRTTNNRMELVAAVKALSFITSLKSKSFGIVIYSDSSYVVNGITKWVNGWKQKGWLTAQKEAVLNRDLWEQLDELSSRFSITWHRVMGHADTPGNTRADEIASAFGDGEAPKLFEGAENTYPIDFKSIGARNSSELADGARKSGRTGKAYSYVSLVDGVIQTHKTWEECKRRVEGRKARFKKALTPLEEKQIIMEFQK